MVRDASRECSVLISVRSLVFAPRIDGLKLAQRNDTAIFYGSYFIQQRHETDGPNYRTTKSVVDPPAANENYSHS